MNSSDVLFRKYLSDSLSVEELQALRETVSHLTDEEIDSCLAKASLESDLAQPALSDDRIEALRRQLLDEIAAQKRRISRYRRMLWAAAVTIPLLLAAGIVLALKVENFSRYAGMLARESVIQTGNGEELTTVLPDGSRIQMAPESTVRYSLADFNDESRLISWEGVGHFDITHNPDCPFTLRTPRFDIKVKGTVFDVDMQTCDKQYQVFLASGSIELVVEGKSYMMKPGELSVIDSATGKITVSVPGAQSPIEEARITDPSLIFTDTPLSEVLRRLNKYYPLTFTAPESRRAQRFTGSLPKDNFNEAVTIICKAYGMKVSTTAERVDFRD